MDVKANGEIHPERVDAVLLQICGDVYKQSSDLQDTYKYLFLELQSTMVFFFNFMELEQLTAGKKEYVNRIACKLYNDGAVLTVRVKREPDLPFDVETAASPEGQFIYEVLNPKGFEHLGVYEQEVSPDVKVAGINLHMTTHRWQGQLRYDQVPGVICDLAGIIELQTNLN